MLFNKTYTFLFGKSFFYFLICCVYLISIPLCLADLDVKEIFSKNLDILSDQVAYFDWNNKTTGTLGVVEKNYNRISGEDWGIVNRVDDKRSPVKRYSVTDPGFSSPNGEIYGVELEFGDSSVQPRSLNTKTVRHYVDCGQSGFQERGHDRSEMHIRSLLEDIGIIEGATAWFGWSEYYSYLDKSRMSTVLQFRNQPSGKVLLKQGINPFNDKVYKEVINGGPAVSIVTQPEDGELYYHFAVRNGTPSKWSTPVINTYTLTEPIKTGVWYDFVWQIKYSRNADGFIRVWFSPASQAKELLRLESPSWVFSGSTMYQYPEIQGKLIKPSPSLRWGVYRYGCKKKNIESGLYPPIDDENRYMIKHLGPVRLWKGELLEGFYLVKPRD